MAKTCREFPDELQAVTKIDVEDACAQWTMYDNLNQCFNDIKTGILATGLIEDEKKVFGAENGALVSAVQFKHQDMQR